MRQWDKSQRYREQIKSWRQNSRRDARQATIKATAVELCCGFVRIAVWSFTQLRLWLLQQKTPVSLSASVDADTVAATAQCR